MRSAAALLAAATSVDGVRDLLRAVGLQGDPVELSDAARDALGLTGMRAELGRAGDCCVLLLAAGDADIRGIIQRTGRRVRAHAPHVQWIIAALAAGGCSAAIAALAPSGGSRVAAFVWEPARVVDSDAETLCALAAVPAADPLFHARCAEVLGRDALTRRFYRALERHVGILADAMPSQLSRDDARGVALLYASRLVFLRFLEAKGWLDGDRQFLATRFDACMRARGGFHHRVLLPLFFGTLNTPPPRRAAAARSLGRIPFLNGGLFARTPLERRAGRWRYPDALVGAFFDEVFHRYRFVAREDTATWSEASVDPEMLGRAFESLMADEERRAGGVFYTPHALVARVAEHALSAAIGAPTLRALRDVRVLDPACGSGAFLVDMLERIAGLRRELGEDAPTSAVRRDVLARSVFGVDRNPTAVWLCELRLWLSVVIESEERDPLRVPPLPNLDRNIRVGDAIAGAGLSPGPLVLPGGARVERLRAAYVRATGTRKRALARQLDREERGRVLAYLRREIDATHHARRERLAAARARDLFGERRHDADARPELRRLRDRLRELRSEQRRIHEGGALPFSFSALFADAQARGGFDVVLGNPPWVRLHRIPERLRRELRARFQVFRSASWSDGAAAAGVSRGFASQVDLAALFVERGVELARDGGALAYLLPAKLWRSLAGGGVRCCLREKTRLLRLEDLSESRHAFDAAVYPSLLVARRGGSPGGPVTVAVHERAGAREWTLAPDALPFDGSPGAPWLLLPPGARAAFDRLRQCGPPLGAGAFGPPRLGVKSGCNAAFIVRVEDSAHGIASVRDADGERGSIELSLLRPVLRGDHVQPWQRLPCDEWIVWTHDDGGAPIPRLPPRAREWLGRRYSELRRRTDAARTRRWWSLFRVNAADMRRWRVVWADIGVRPRAAVLAPGDPAVPLNSCYALPCDDEEDAWALAVLLNSPLAAAWLDAIAEPARGGYRRYLGWTVGLLPIPRNWSAARPVLARARGGEDDRLIEATLAAFRLGRGDVDALLAWRR